MRNPVFILKSSTASPAALPDGNTQYWKDRNTGEYPASILDGGGEHVVIIVGWGK